MKTKALAAALLGVFLPLASEASELSVSGRIMPEACSIILPEGDLLNFGELQVNESGGSFSFADGKLLPIEINCNAKTNVGLKFRDLMLDDAEPRDWFALVGDDEELIGQVKVNIGPATADGKPITVSMLHPYQGYQHNAIVGDPENYMQIENSDQGGYKNIKIPSYVRLNGSDLEAKHIVNAGVVRSQIGIDLHYL